MPFIPRCFSFIGASARRWPSGSSVFKFLVALIVASICIAIVHVIAMIIGTWSELRDTTAFSVLLQVVEQHATLKLELAI